MTYAAPLKVTLRLIVFEVDEDTGAKSVKDIKEQDVFMGDMPLMTDNGTFIVNGTERVIVSQMHRSLACSSITTKARPTHRASFCLHRRVIPYRGSWLDFEFDAKDMSMSVSTVAGSCLSPRCCMRWASIRKRSCDLSTTTVEYAKKGRLARRLMPSAARHQA